MSDYPSAFVPFIGGENDGRQMRVKLLPFYKLPVPDEIWDASCRVECSVKVETYRREQIACERETFYVYVLSEMDLSEAIARLLRGYHPKSLKP